MYILSYLHFEYEENYQTDTNRSFSKLVESHVTDTNVYNMHKTTDSWNNSSEGRPLAGVRCGPVGEQRYPTLLTRYYLLTAMGPPWLAPEDWVKCRLLTYLSLSVNITHLDEFYWLENHEYSAPVQGKSTFTLFISDMLRTIRDGGVLWTIFDADNAVGAVIVMFLYRL